MSFNLSKAILILNYLLAQPRNSKQFNNQFATVQ
jgi:hypothetical protein